MKIFERLNINLWRWNTSSCQFLCNI